MRAVWRDARSFPQFFRDTATKITALLITFVVCALIGASTSIASFLATVSFVNGGRGQSEGVACIPNQPPKIVGITFLVRG